MPDIAKTPEELLTEAEGRMAKTEEALQRDLATLRTGRASPALLDRLQVDYYGAATPVNQLATVSVPEPRVLLIQPWDQHALSAIEKAIQRSDLGLNPSNDGKVIRLVIPSLTEERRKELAKVVHRKEEEGKVAVRNIRRDAADHLKALEKDKKISTDEEHRHLERLQKLTDAAITAVEQLARAKEQEVLATR